MEEMAKFQLLAKLLELAKLGDAGKFGEMSKLGGLSKMLEDLGENEGGEEMKKKKKENKENAKKTAKTIHLLYTASKVRIYKIADKIASCEVGKDVALQEKREIDIPAKGEWDFKLGDRVRIKYSLQDFKSIQCRTLGWNKKLHVVYGKVGFITKMRCKYENSVQVYISEIYSTSSLYPGVLEIDTSEEKNPIPSQWKVGDYVTTKTDLKVVELLQRRRDTIPRKYWGIKGRVIAVTRAAIVVTFDERTSFDINSYLLDRCPDQSPVVPKVVEHARGFKIGEKVKMISNFKKLIENQKDKGGWNSTMSIAGQEVTIVHIQKNGTMNVQPKLGKSWRVNSDSVMKMEEAEYEIKEEDIDLVRGDVVKINIAEDIRVHLAAANVPVVFLEYPRSTATLELVDDDFDFLVQFNCDQKVAAFAPTLRKATQEELAKHQEIKTMETQLEVGHPVYLDVGPPNYVRSMLCDINASIDVIRALTAPAKLIGYASDGRSVIEYENGKRYKIKKKFLTVPDKFKIRNAKDGMSFETAKEIQTMVATCVRIMSGGAENKTSEDECSVGILSMVYGTPPLVDLRIYSMVATPPKICELLLPISGWDIDVESPGTFYVNKLESYTQEVKVGLYFNDEDYVPRLPQAAAPSSGKMKEIVHRRTSYTEGAAADPAAVPIVGPLPCAELDAPDVESVKEFKYLRLFDPSLAQNVYFPYLVHGQRRTPQEPDDGPDDQGRTTNIIYNIDKVDTITCR